MIKTLLLLCAAAAGLQAQPEVLDRVVAVVGREYILQSDLNAQTEFYALSNRIEASTPGLRQQVLDAMVNEKLILTRALEDTTLVVRDEDVTAQLDALIADRVRQAGSEQRLEELYGMPVSKMKREFRDDMRRQLLAAQLWEVKRNAITPSRREVEDFFTAYKDSIQLVPEELELYHIFKLPKVSDQAHRLIMEKAQRILDSIKAGGDFADFARRYSEDPGSAQAGGDLGFARRGQFFKEFEEALFSLKEQQLANIVETPVGLHIMQLLERRGESVHARHILLRIDRTPADADSAKAVLSRLKDSVVQHGANFADLAKAYSDDKETAPMGGFLGRFAVTQFDEALLKAVSVLKEGEVTDPLEIEYGTARGFHIVLLKRRITEHKINLTDDWKRVEQLATAFKRNQEYQKWIKELREEIYVDVRL